MASIDQQQHGLEVLKSINKAVTNLRLYPEQSVQVLKAVENAYAELKIFIRQHGSFHFGLHHGGPTINDFRLDKKAREQLSALTLVDVLDKAGFTIMALAPGIDRKQFKQVLSFFTATPEQLQRSGGSLAFVQQAGLANIFRQAVSDNKGLAGGRDFADFWQQSVVNGLRQEEILLFLQAARDSRPSEKIQQDLAELDKGAHILAASVCYLLHPLQQRTSAYQKSADFAQFLKNISISLKDEDIDKIAVLTAALLVAKLNKESLSQLFCQITETRFGKTLFDRLVTALDKELFQSLIDFLQQESERLVGSRDAESRMLMDTRQHLMATVRGRQLQAVVNMGLQEKERQDKRVQTGISILAQGNIEGLRNKEILQCVADISERLIQNKKENVVTAIIQTLVGGLKQNDKELRDRSGQGLSLIGNKLVALGYWGWLEKLTPTFLFLLRKTEEIDESCVRLVTILQHILTNAQQTGKENLVDNILPLFYAIRSGALKEQSGIRELVAQVQDKAVDLNVLQSYLKLCLEKPAAQMHCQKIVMHGPVGIKLLLDTLLVNQNKVERIRILKILVGIGAMLSPILLERLQEPMPWYGKRNLIKLLGDTGVERDVSAVQSYLSHDDLRVQSEALSCIYKISAQNKKQYLLDALVRVSEKLKFRVVLALASVIDAEVVGVLIEMLQDIKYFSPDIKNTLLASICRTLGRSGSDQAQQALQLLVGGESTCPKNMDIAVWQAAQRGLILLDTNRRQQQPRQAEVQQDSEKDDLPATAVHPQSADVAYTEITNLEEEREVYLLLQQHKKVAAKELLLELISTLAALHHLEEAALLCRRLAEIDPLALDDIIRAQEIVEEQKIAGSSQGQSLGWAEVYDFLSTDEFNAFYAAIEHVQYAPDENIIMQGDLRQRLFFINKGSVKMFCRDPHGNDILLKKVRSGEIFGVDSFFKESVWTVNVASIGAVDAFILPREALRKWQHSFPDLESKLKNFCLHFIEHDLPRIKTIDRRSTERLNYAGTMAVAILDDHGQATGTVLQGDKGDVSVGGVATSIHIGHKRSVRLLLGRKVAVTLHDELSGKPVISGATGLIVAIYEQNAINQMTAAHMDYSLHIQFDHQLQATQLALVVSNH